MQQIVNEHVRINIVFSSNVNSLHLKFQYSENIMQQIVTEHLKINFISPSNVNSLHLKFQQVLNEQ